MARTNEEPVSFLDHARPQYTSEERVSRGQHAGRLLRDEVLKSALEEIELNMVEAWRDTKDSAERDRCWATMHALGEIERVLRKIEDDGVIETSRNR